MWVSASLVRGTVVWVSASLVRGTVVWVSASLVEELWCGLVLAW